jgi:glyoxylase-like metal-dependent hydrolase (beta-lactamase superfamily II)
MTPDRLRLGEFTVYGLRDGFFFLDGGAMFGVVPKTLWEKKCPADPHNRIKMGLNSILVKTPRALVLVETGIGPKLGRKLSGIYCVQREPGLLGALSGLGFKPEDIDFVINTHLHFDHCGGNTVIDEKGAVVPAFPRARYIIQRGEWEWATHPHERERTSYQPDNFRPLAEHGLLELVDGDAEVASGVDVVMAPGHTARHQSVKVRSGGKTLVYLGDLVPTSAHIGLAYGMSYDLDPLGNLETKKKVYEQAIAEDWILAFVHDPVYYFGRVKKSDTRYVFQPLGE